MGGWLKSGNMVWLFIQIPMRSARSERRNLRFALANTGSEQRYHT
jgi:hypothetical protein